MHERPLQRDAATRRPIQRTALKASSIGVGIRVVVAALTLGVTACGGRVAGPVVAPRPEPTRPTETTPLATALQLMGAPYRDGGSTPRGFDCSGFVQYVFGVHGVRLPRTTGAQYDSTRRVSRQEAVAGDLVFFHTTARGASHVGILVDRERFIHAPSERGQVRIEPLSLPYWRERIVGFRRVLKPPTAAPSPGPRDGA